MDPTVILNRLLRLARLDTTVFEEVRDDANETIPAIVIAVASCLLAALGLFIYVQTFDGRKPDSAFLNTVVLGTIFTAAVYGLWVVVSYLVIVQLFKAQADLMSLIRTMGYGALPLAASVFLFIPILFPVFAVVPIALLIVFSIYAVQTCTDAEPGQVVLANLIGMTVFVLVLGFIAKSTDLSKMPIAAGIFGLIRDIR